MPVETRGASQGEGTELIFVGRPRVVRGCVGGWNLDLDRPDFNLSIPEVVQYAEMPRRHA